MNRSRGKRHRYIGFRIIEPTERFGKGAMIRVIREKTREVLGSKSKDAGIKLVRFNGIEGAVHCFHLYKDDTIRMLKSINEVGGKKVKVETIGTSGTIKTLNKKFFKGKLGKEFAIY